MGPTMAEGGGGGGTIACKLQPVNRNSKAACLPHGGLNFQL